MVIGDRQFPLGTVLAPMAGFTDASMRLLCRRLGAELTVTEMISAAALCFRDRKTARLARLPAGDDPAAVQLFGHDPDQIRRAAAMIAAGDYEGVCTDVPPAMIDLNMGCPVKKIVTAGDGSALMRDPDLAGRIVRAAVAGAEPYGIPVTVKIRAGWDENSKNAVAVAKIAAENGAAAVTVHGRTRAQMYAPSADWTVIAAVRDALAPGIPVIGNGDVVTAEDYLRMRRETGCDGVAVGRAALGDPWVFAAIRAAVGGETFTPPIEEERRRTAYALAEAVIAAEGPGAVRECRGRIAHFLRGMRGAAEMRAEVHRAESVEDLRRILLAPAGDLR